MTILRKRKTSYCMTIANNAAVKARKAELLQAFLRQVPGRVAAILENWHRLVQSDWDSSTLANLRERIYTLAEAGGKFGVRQIKQSAQSLETHLGEYAETNSKPHHDDIVALDGLIHAFKQAALQACDLSQNHDLSSSSELNEMERMVDTQKAYLLGIDSNLVPGLEKALTSHQFNVQSLIDARSAIERYHRHEPCVLISHIDWLDELYPETKSGGLWKQEDGSRQLPVAFIAESSDLQTRLKAMRTEASAFWSTPVEPLAVANRMQQLAAPKRSNADRVMIVDDDPAQADFAVAILRKAGFETHAVTDPLRVMEALQTFKPDLILMDLYMPGASGTELTTVIREQPEYVDTPIVFLSGEQDLDKQLMALSFGGEDFLAKPIGPKHLISTVRNRIKRARAILRKSGTPSRRDIATDLYSRSYLFERIAALQSSGKDSNEVPAVFYLEIDSPEEILDAVGIGGMDAVLTDTGKTISIELQPHDVLARFGDASLALVASRSSIDELKQLAEQLGRKVEEQIIEVDNKSLGVTLSTGICPINNFKMDPETIISRALGASRKALKKGGNQVHLYTPSKSELDAQDKNDSIAVLIQEAMKNRYFQVYYQPMVALQGSAAPHYQTLIRLQAPDGELLTAAAFIPTAERIGVISKLDHWTTQQALGMIHEHRRKNMAIHLFVSQSVELMTNMERMAWLQDQHRIGNLHEGDLTFEFPVSAVVQNIKPAQICIDTLAKMGISVLLTGVRGTPDCQRVMKHVNIRYIKLDRRMLDGSAENLKELISLAHELKIKVIAPQVEDPRSIAQLWSSDADFVQGNFVQRPENNLSYDFNESVLH